MSGLFGNHTQSVTPTRYNGIQISSSASGGCIPLIYGQQRAPFNLIWYGNFQSKAVQGSGGGGKGGGGNNVTGYNYSASFAAAICEGPISSIQNVYNDKTLTSISALGLTIFVGTGGQAVWSYLTTNFPTQAIPYDHICYAGAVNYQLGNQAALPNITFEVRAFLANNGTQGLLTANPVAGATSATLSSALAAGTWNITFSDNEVQTCTVSGSSLTWSTPLNNACTNVIYVGAYLDADPSLMIYDYLTDPNHGVGFPTSSVGTFTGSNSYQSYCLALGLTMSPIENTQRAAADFITEVLKITNSDAVWSAGVLKIQPYADAPVAGNGYTYVPALTPLYIFTNDDFTDAPDLKRKAVADTYNHVRVEYLNRSNQYNSAIVEATDLGNIAATGERVMDTLNFHELTNGASALMAAQLALQTSLYERNTMTVKIRADYCLLEPMDYVGICDPVNSDGSGLGYGTINNVGQETSSQVFRVTKITEDDKDVLELELMEIPGTVRTAAVYNWANVQGYNANFGVIPGSIQTPAFLEAYETLVGPSGGRELWIAVAGPSGSTAWGGCVVYMSLDNTTYEQVATIAGPARYGTLSTAMTAGADPDTVNTPQVTLNNTALILTGGTQADADGDRLLIAVGSGATVEIISFETAALVTAGTYTLSYLRRGQYGTTSQPHSIGAQFIRLDGNLLKLEMDPGYIGTTLYFKFCSFNMVGLQTQALSAVTAYSYTPGQSTSAYNVVSSSTFLVGPGSQCAVYSPTTAFEFTTSTLVWGSSVYSAQSYTNGCTGEFSPSQTTGAVMMGLTTNPLASNSYTNLLYAWYCTTSGTLQIYESSTLVGTYGNYTTSDLLSITYDGKSIVYYHNGAIVRSVSINLLQPLFLQYCFSAAGTAIYAMSYSNLSPTSNQVTWLPYNANSAIVGNTVKQVSTAVNTWTAGAYANQSYSNGCSISWTTGYTDGYGYMVGLTTNPTVSVSYTNIAYAMQVVTGNVNIYLLGTYTGITATYTGSPVFEIIYDGKHVNFYVGGQSIYSIPITISSPLYPQVALDDPGITVTNLAWGSLNQATTPFTLVPLANGVLVNGNTVKTNAANPNDEFGVRGWKSLESYSTGCTCAGVCPTINAQYFGLSNNPVLNSAYGSNMTAVWYPHSDVGLAQVFYNGANVANVAIGPTTDVYTIEYDTFYFYWYRNGTLVYQQYSPGAGALYLYGDSYYQGSAWAQLSFGPNGALTPNPFLTYGGCVTHDSTAIKATAGSGSDSGWDSAVYSINGYLTCHVQFKFTGPLQMFGLSTAANLPPVQTTNIGGYEHINYAWYQSSSYYQIYESGSLVYTGTVVPVATDLLAITYDGANVRYYLNGSVIRTIALSGATLYASSSFYTVGQGVTSLSFGPGVTLDTVPTAGIDTNAATAIAVISSNTPTSVVLAPPYTVLTSLTVGPYEFPTTIVCTASGRWLLTNSYAGSNEMIVSAGFGSTAIAQQFYIQDDIIVAASSAINKGWAVEGTYTLAPNTTQTYYLLLYVAQFNVPVSFAMENYSFKVEVIKV